MTESESPFVLEFRGVTAAEQPPYDGGLEDVSFALRPGELLWVLAEPGRDRLPLADLAGGLLDPQAGAVIFDGEDWADLSPDRGAAQRGLLRRVFDHGGWLSNLDVDENIILAQRFHAARADADLHDEAGRVAAALGLAEIPRVRPALLPRHELRRLQWVRAFMGEPALLLLEEPLRGLPSAWTPPLLRHLQAWRERGGAVLWLAADPAEAARPDLKPTLKMAMQGAKMQPVPE